MASSSLQRLVKPNTVKPYLIRFIRISHYPNRTINSVQQITPSSSLTTTSHSANLAQLTFYPILCKHQLAFIVSSRLRPLSTNAHKTNSTVSHPQQSSQPIPIRPDPNLMRYADDLINFIEKPPRTWLTVIKVLLTVLAGLGFGAFLAKLGANLLEEYEIFVRGNDDDDD